LAKIIFLFLSSCYWHSCYIAYISLILSLDVCQLFYCRFSLHSQ